LDLQVVKMKSKGAIKMFQYKQPDLKHLVEKNSICWIMFADMNWRIIALLFSLTSATALAQKEEYLVPGHNLFVNNIAALHRYYPRWNGAGIRLSIKEFRFAGTDIDILGRIVANPNAAANVTSHANNRNIGPKSFLWRRYPKLVWRTGCRLRPFQSVFSVSYSCVFCRK
jgi:hypothetical protein